jgi:hypothetical protein
MTREIERFVMLCSTEIATGEAEVAKRKAGLRAASPHWEMVCDFKLFAEKGKPPPFVFDFRIFDASVASALIRENDLLYDSTFGYQFLTYSGALLGYVQVRVAKIQAC